MLAREALVHDTELIAPPAGLWPAIEAAAGLGGAHHSKPSMLVGLEPGPASEHGVPADPGPAVVDLSIARQARRVRSGWATGIAAAVLVFVAGAATLGRLPGQTDGGRLLADAEVANAGLPVAFDGAGTASLRSNGDDLYLELGLPSLPPVGENDAYYEVWMIDSNTEGMVSLGGVSTGQETVRIDLPDNIDHHRFPVVDISIEPLDGDPTHSGQSVLRGVLVDNGA